MLQSSIKTGACSQNLMLTAWTIVGTAAGLTNLSNHPSAAAARLPSPVIHPGLDLKPAGATVAMDVITNTAPARRDRSRQGIPNRRNQHISIENIFHIAYDITLSVTSNLLTHKTLRPRGSLPSCPPCLKGDLNVIATHAADGDVVLMQETRTHNSRTCRRSVFLAKSASSARRAGAGSYQFRSG